MTNKESPARILDIKQSIASVTTCSSSTVEALSALLISESVPKVQVVNAHHASRSRKPQSSTARHVQAPNNRPQKKPNVKVLEVEAPNQEQFSLGDRFRLATEVVNATLRALTDVLKASTRNNLPRKPLSSIASGAQCSSNLISGPPRPLQPICLNKVSAWEIEEKIYTRRSSSTANCESAVGVIALAQCAHLAFTALRKLDSVSEPELRMPYLQLEIGMSVYINKLIALGMDDLATKELRILTKRLTTQDGTSTALACSKKILADRHKLPSEKQTLTDLLRVQQIPSDPKVLNLVITSQVQVVKLLVLKKRVPSIEAALDHLQQSNPSSPIKLIEHLVGHKSTETCEKAVKQLELLRNALIALCTSSAHVDDELARDSRRSPCPHTVLQYQMLILDLQFMLWKLSKQKINLRSEVFGPFKTYLSAFCRRSILPADEKYDTAKRVVDVLAETTRQYVTSQAEAEEQEWLDIFVVLADLAQRCQRYPEVNSYITQIISMLKNLAVSHGRKCHVLCHAARIHMQGYQCPGRNDSEENTKLLQETVVAIRGSLQGDSMDLDDLLVNTAEVRKAAFAILFRHTKIVNWSDMPLYERLCLDIVLSSSTFLDRYLGVDPDPTAGEKRASRFERRRALAARFARPTIEAVTWLTKLPLATDAEAWKLIEATMQSCANLAEKLSAAEDSQSSFCSERSPTLRILLSNAYWRQYLLRKEAGSNPSEIRLCLCKSIDLLRQCSTPEKAASFLPIKLEHLAALTAASKEALNARQIYSEALLVLIEEGSVHLAATASATASLSIVFEREPSAIILARLLASHTRVSRKSSSEPDEFFFDDDRLPPNERGVLLEHQLAVLIALMRPDEVSSHLRHAFDWISETLFGLYDEAVYPVRRLRVCVNILRFVSMHQSSFSVASVEKAIQDAGFSVEGRLGDDMGLHPYISHLLASRDAYSAMLSNSLNSTAMQRSLDAWSHIVQQCKGLEALRNKVDDIPQWLGHLDSIVEYLGMQGCEIQRALYLQLVSTVRGEGYLTSDPNYLSSLIAFGLQLVRLGYSGKAGVVLQKARKHLETSDVRQQVVLSWHMAYAEYLLNIGNIDKSEQSTANAMALITAIDCTDRAEPTDADRRWTKTLMAADLTFLLSLQALARNQSSKALVYGKRSTRMVYKLWAVLRHRDNAAVLREIRAMDGGDHATEEDLTVPLTEKHVPSRSVAFWPIIPKLFYRLLHLSKIFAHDGLLLDAQHYAEQATRIVESVQATILRAQASTILGDYAIRRGQRKEGMVQLEQAVMILSNSSTTHATLVAHFALANGFASNSNWSSEANVLEVAQNLITGRLSNLFAERSDRSCAKDTELELQMGRLKIETPSHCLQQHKRTLPSAKRSTQTKAEGVLSTNNDDSQSADCFPLLRYQAHTFRLLASCAARAKKFELAASYIQEAKRRPAIYEDKLHEAMVAAQLLLSQALEDLSSHPVLNVLPESTLSCPSTTFGGRCASKDCVDTIGRDVGRTTINKKAKSQGVKKTGDNRLAAESRELSDNLCRSFEIFDDINQLVQTSCSISTLQSMSAVFSRIIMMLSAVCPALPQTNICSTLAVYAMELGRSSAMVRERSSIHIEKLLSVPQTSSSNIGTEIGDCSEAIVADSCMDMASFQAEYIDIIPRSWTVVTIALSEHQDELRLARIRALQPPFVLVIPLNRHSLQDGEEESFGFSEAKEELLEVIKAANDSTHAAHDLSRKGAKTEWWETRAAIDARLKDLLVNIENIWLGGFRGIFSQHSARQDLLSRFHLSFTNILNKHLPSRQRVRKEKTLSPVMLDPRVLELFVALGHPGEVGDLDEPLMDLLYFVIDILQFNGERNAYDEIEFDSITLETLDALTQYHEALRNDEQEALPPHTILVLDKALHCFPWESLPCMTGLAISRLPSLRFLKSSILRQRTQCLSDPTLSTEGYHINSANGAYILNPVGDLVATQSLFEKPLASLEGWSATVNTEPSEVEIAKSLSSRDLYLYFGHGSGGQYIRSRVVQRLDQCAVALLMGCSSATLIEEGEFESHGTPNDYLHAGAQAVVGTLWNVTDKDIDRFSMKVLEEWGLFEHEGEKDRKSPVKKGSKVRARAMPRIVAIEKGKSAEKKGKTTLDQAISMGRDACFLRYLNGAAPVVYGVPVFLK